jgi:putative redox protein
MTAPVAPKTANPPSRVHVRWAGEQVFEAGRPNAPTAIIDGNGKAGQSPPEALLSALASCVSVDVVEILAKRRTPVKSLEIDVVGERVDTTPRRYKSITLNFRIGGVGIDKDQALRAIDLAATKYCSVRDSLRNDMEIAWTVELEEESTGAH